MKYVKVVWLWGGGIELYCVLVVCSGSVWLGIMLCWLCYCIG